MSIKLEAFDSGKSGNTLGIKHVMQHVKETAPEGARVAWEFPGYVSIVLSNGREIAFGDSLEGESGYSWNCYELDGTNDLCGAFDDLKDIEEITKELWRQAAPLLESGE